MINVELIENLRGWIEAKVASRVELKVPVGDIDDEDYEIEFAHPSVFSYFVPPSSVNAELPYAPSICVQFLETEEQFKGTGTGDKSIRVRIAFVVWNPGEHVVFEPHEDISKLGAVAYTPNTEGYVRTLDGWKDLVNLQDETLKQIKGAEYIEGMKVDLKSIKYGMFKDEEDSIYLYYPYWQGYIDFSVTLGATRLAPDLLDI